MLINAKAWVFPSTIGEKCRMIGFDSTNIQKVAQITRTGSFSKDLTIKWIETAQNLIDWSSEFSTTDLKNSPNWFMAHNNKNQTEEVILRPKSRNIRNIGSNFKYNENRLRSMVELYYMRPDLYENDIKGKLAKCSLFA